jgi:rubrerythrin
LKARKGGIVKVAFNAFEVFEIAEQIERNGTRFYIRAAELFDERRICRTFLRLAEWEKEHERTFAGMKQRLAEQEPAAKTPGPDDLLPDPRVMAGMAVFGLRPDPGEELGDKANKKDIICMALEKEKDSIVFYHGLKEFVPDGADKDKINDIIKEEMKHVVILGHALNKEQ